MGVGGIGSEIKERKRRRRGDEENKKLTKNKRERGIIKIFIQKGEERMMYKKTREIDG